MTPIQPPKAARRTLAAAVVVGMTFPASAAIAYADDEDSQTLERGSDTIELDTDSDSAEDEPDEGSESTSSDEEESDSEDSEQEGEGSGEIQDADDESQEDEPEPADTPVEAARPAEVGDNQVEVPTVEGVSYTAGDTALTGGQVIDVSDGGLTIHASAQDGYELTGQSEFFYEYVEPEPEDEVVEPAAPDFDGETVTVPENTGVSSEPGPGSYTLDPGESLSVSYWANEGYEIAEGAQTEFSFTNENEPEPIVVEPQTPTQNEETGTVSIPEVEGVTYSPEPGEHEVGEDGLHVTAEAAEGYTFPDGAETQWSFDPVEDDDPDYDPEVSADGTVVTVTGAEPDQDYTFSTGRWPTGSSAEVTADDNGTAAFDVTDWDLDPGEHEVRVSGAHLETTTVTVTIDEDQEEVTPESPAHDEDANTVTIPEVDGVIYRSDDDEVTGEVEIPEDGLTITAEPEDGYTFPDDAQTHWDYDYTDEEPDLEEVTPEEPSQDEETGTVSVPEVEGVIYSPEPGEHEVEDEGLTVTAEPEDGYEFPEDAETEWSFDPVEDDDPDYDPEVAADGTVVTVTGGEPGEDYRFSTGQWPFGDSVTVPADEDGEASFDVAEWDLEPGEHEVRVRGEHLETTTVTVTIDEDLEEVTPESPAHDEDANTVTIPEVEGVIYRSDDDEVTGEVEIPEDGLSLTAEPENGYTFPDGAQTQWDYDYTDEEPDLEEVTPQAPQFNSTTGVVTVLETDGVNYSHQAGDHQLSDGDTLTVTAEPAEGYVFPSGAQTQWSFEYNEPDPDPVLVQPQAPGHDAQNNAVIINDIDGVVYSQTGTVTIPEEGLTITASPAAGYTFPDGAQAEWHFEHTPTDPDPTDPDPTEPPPTDPDDDRPADPDPTDPGTPGEDDESGSDPAGGTDDEDDSEDEAEQGSEEDSAIAEDSDLEASGQDDDQDPDWQGSELPTASGDDSSALDSDDQARLEDEDDSGLSAQAPAEALEAPGQETSEQDSDDISLTEDEALESSDDGDEPDSDAPTTEPPESGSPDDSDESDSGQVEAADSTERVSTITWIGGLIAAVFLAIAAGLIWFFGFARGRQS